MTLHIYRANDQPATRYKLVLDMPSGTKTIWMRSKQRTLFYCRMCRKKRWAGNLIAHVYYDGTWFYCRPGKGCKA